jgi:flagellar motor switch protein FliN/FliY
MIMRVQDVKAIVELLLGDDQGEDSGEGLDEIHVSALGEVMNQMMGASCTALASFLDRNIDISPPTPFEITDISQKLLDAKQQDYIVTVGFKLMIEGLVDSEFVTVMPVPFAKELVKNAMVEAGAIEVQSEMQSEVQSEVQPEVKKEEQTIPQVTGHTQIPAPVHEADFQPPQPKPAPRPAPAPAPAPAYAPAPAPTAGYSAPKMPPPKDVVVKPLQFGSFDSGEAASEEMDQVNLGLVMGVDLNVTVEIGRTKKQVKEILSLRQGSIVELDKQAGDPVDIVVNGKLIARGDVVVIDDNFGVRVTEIVNSKSKSRW